MFKKNQERTSRADEGDPRYSRGTKIAALGLLAGGVIVGIAADQLLSHTEGHGSGFRLGEVTAELQNKFGTPLPFRVVAARDGFVAIPNDPALRGNRFVVVNPTSFTAGVVAHDVIRVSTSDSRPEESVTCYEQSTPMITTGEWNEEANRLTERYIPPMSCLKGLLGPEGRGK